MWKLAGAFGLAAIALFMLTGFFASGGAQSGTATFAALALVVGLPATGSALLLRSHLRERDRLGTRAEMLRQQTIESEILRIAAQHAGRVTAAELATHLAMTLEQAKEALDRMALRSQAEFEVTESGLIVYRFDDVRHLDEKQSSRGLLDA